MKDIVEDSHNTIHHDWIKHGTFIGDVSGKIFSLNSLSEQYAGRIFDIFAFPGGWLIVIKALFKLWIPVHELVSRSRELVSMDLC